MAPLSYFIFLLKLYDFFEKCQPPVKNKKRTNYNALREGQVLSTQ